MKKVACKIGGRLWTVRFGKPRTGEWGYCDHENRVIVIEKDASPEMQLDAVIHEFEHARRAWMHEDEVEPGATELKNLLWQLGWRSPNPEDQ